MKTKIQAGFTLAVVAAISACPVQGQQFNLIQDLRGMNVSTSVTDSDTGLEVSQNLGSSPPFPGQHWNATVGVSSALASANAWQNSEMTGTSITAGISASGFASLGEQTHNTYANALSVFEVKFSVSRDTAFVLSGFWTPPDGLSTANLSFVDLTSNSTLYSSSWFGIPFIHDIEDYEKPFSGDIFAGHIYDLHAQAGAFLEGFFGGGGETGSFDFTLALTPVPETLPVLPTLGIAVVGLAWSHRKFAR